MIAANIIRPLLIGGAGFGTGTGIFFIRINYFSNDKALERLGKGVGLSCIGNPTGKLGTLCFKKSEESILKAKRDDINLNISSITRGRIKAYKDGGYENGYKFVIEDGDILETQDDIPDTNKKLEQFETYEIKKEEDGWWMIRKTDARTEIKKALGLPGEDEECVLPEGKEEKTCSLDEEKLKAINFEGKSPEGLILEGEGELTLSLKIKRMKDSNTEEETKENRIFRPYGYKFTLTSNRDITLDTSKVIRKNTNTEFKLKVSPASKTDPKVITLEKAWTAADLGHRGGLKCSLDEEKECTLKNRMNVDNGDGKKYFGLNAENKDEGDKKVKYEENVGDHNQGFKFFVEEESDISLKNGTSRGTTESNNDKKILRRNGTEGVDISYEILKGEDYWYLTKKTTPATSVPTPAPAPVPAADTAQVTDVVSSTDTGGVPAPAPTAET